MDYETDIQIDEQALDVEWLDQPRLMMRMCQHAEGARQESDWAKERLDIKKAELDRAIRADPEEYQIKRISEAAIQNAIQLDPEYQKVSKKFIDAKYESNMANAAVRAFDQRKTALENLVRLHGQQYFAGPRAPRDLSEERERRQTQSNAKVGQAMRRRRT